MVRGRTTALVGAALLTAALASPAAAQEPTIETVVSGLATPRGVTIAADGTVYVAEAGSSGEQCVGEGADQMCMGPSGGVSRIVDGAAERVVDGLLSVGAGPEVLGISDVTVAEDGSMIIVMNSGGDPADRAGFGPEAASVAGWLLRASADGTVEPWVDVAAYESEANPEPTLLDSNPYSITAVEGGYVVADAGANALLMVTGDGTISTVAVFPPFEALFPAEVLAAMGPPPEGEGGPPAAESSAPAESAAPAEAPAESAAPAEAPAESAAPGRRPAAESAAPADGGAPAEGEMVPLMVEAVPTSVVVGPDGALYMGQLTGGPFPIGGASVWRVTTDGAEPTKYAEGFTNIIDIAFGPDGTLYVAEIVHEGLGAVFGGGAAPIGAVLSVPPGGGEPTLIVSDERVMAPGGIAVDADGAIWLSTNTLPAGADGQLVKITQ